MDVIRFLKRLIGMGPTLRPPEVSEQERLRGEWERRQVERRLEVLEQEAALMQRRRQSEHP